MPTTYTRAGAEVDRMVADRLAAAESDLSGAGVRVGALFAYNPDGPAVKHGGYGAAATVKVVGLKDRVSKGYDAELLVDQTIWDELRPRQRAALVAHELRHLRLVPASPKSVREGGPAWKLDDLGRPKLKAEPADWASSDGFRDVVAEFGDDAIEYDSLRRAWANADAAREKGEHGREDAGQSSQPAVVPFSPWAMTDAEADEADEREMAGAGPMDSEDM